MEFNDKTIDLIVEMVSKELQNKESDHGQSARPSAYSGKGMFGDVNEAVEAAWKAQKELKKLTLEERKKITDSIVSHIRPHIEELARMELEETGMGNYEDKLIKLRATLELTPSVEDLTANIDAGDEGIALYEHAPFGVIGALTPSTNPPETVINNSIIMIAAGNTVVFSTHPNAYRSSSRAVELVTEAIALAGGPDNLITSIAEPTMEKTELMMKHPKVTVLCATGGPGVVKAILSCGKKGIGAGAGNPPVFVDDTADLEKAGKDIVAGASYDYNIPCIAEKTIIVMNDVAEKLIAALQKNGAYLIREKRIIDKLTKLCMPEEDKPNKSLIGKSPAYILSQVGVKIPENTKIAIFEASKDNMLVMNEQMMPVIPVVRVKTAEEGIDLSVEVEGGRRHTAALHSKNLDVVTEYTKRLQCTLVAVNGPSYSTMGVDGIGYDSLTIAGPTGEGPTTPRTFTRKRKIVLNNGLNIRAKIEKR